MKNTILTPVSLSKDVLITPQRVDSVGDPLMFIVPPLEQYLNTMTSFALFDPTPYNIRDNYISILSVCATLDGLRFDGETVLHWDKLQDHNSTMCAVRNIINSVSVHNVSHVTPDALFTAFLYGFDGSVGYGHAVGFGVEPITCTIFDEITNTTSEIWCSATEPGKFMFNVFVFISYK